MKTTIIYDMSRIFIAAKIDFETQNALYNILVKKRNDQRLFRLIPPSNLHITLKFLGQISQDQIQQLIAVVRETGSEFTPPAMKFSGGGVFPTVTRARILWIGLTPGTSLKTVVESIESGCEKLGLPRERKPFHPHVTLARVARPVGQQDQLLIRDWIESLNQAGEFSYQIKNISIYDSDLSQKSPVYREVFTVKCKS